MGSSGKNKGGKGSRGMAQFKAQMTDGRMRVCIHCGCMEPFQLLSEEGCFRTSRKRCAFTNVDCDGRGLGIGYLVKKDDDPDPDGWLLGGATAGSIYESGKGGKGSSGSIYEIDDNTKVKCTKAKYKIDGDCWTPL